MTDTNKCIPLSRYGTLSSKPAPVNRMMAAFAEDFRPDIDINLGVGYVNESTIPREAIQEALETVLAEPSNYPMSLNYGGSRGSENLTQAIQRFIIDNKIGGLTQDALSDREIIIGPNGATSILDGIADILEPGIVITSDPMYYIYCNALERKGFEIIAVPENDDGIDTERLISMIECGEVDTGRVRFIYVVTVNNPSAVILANERRLKLLEIAETLSDRNGQPVPLFFDRAYEDLIHDQSVEAVRSVIPEDSRELVYEIGTLSKMLAPALRIGYLLGPKSTFMQAMVQKTNDAGFSAPLILQEIASYLLDQHIDDQLTKVNAGYHEKARIVGECIEEKLGGYLEHVSGGKAGFYFYLTFKDIETTESSLFFKFLARTSGDQAFDGPTDNPAPRVIYVPGEFCVHPRGDMVGKGRRQLRLSYGFEETERIVEAIGFMREAAEYVKSLRLKD